MLLADVTEGGEPTELDGVTASYTYDWHDKPSDAYRLGEEANGVIIIIANPNDATANANCYFKLYGYAEGGPSEFICDVSCTTGTARINDTADALWVDTMTVVSQGHIKNVSIDDSGNNRVAKLSFDATGLKYLYPEHYDMSAGHARAYIRVF